MDYYEVLHVQRHAYLKKLKRHIENNHLNGTRTKILKIKKKKRSRAEIPTSTESYEVVSYAK
jgi:hypothetical protein